MGQYTVYCNDNANFKNVANGTGELRIQDTSMRADGVIYFDTASVQEGDVLESSPSLMLYCQAATSYTLRLGGHEVPNGETPAWKQASNALTTVGNRLKCDISVTAKEVSPVYDYAKFWMNGSDHVPYATIVTRAGIIRPVDCSPTGTTLRKGFFHRFSWSTSAETPFNGTLSVAYSEFQWRANGTTEWTTVRVAGDRNYIDFDTGVVPNAQIPGMEWRVVCYGKNGASATSALNSVQFQSTSVRLTDLVPASRAKTFKGFPVTCTWELSYTKPDSLSGELHQTSARIRWRKSGADDYTEYSIQGAVQSYTIAADILPAGEIDWQVETTDTSGGTAASSWTTFENQELTVEPTDLYPADGGRILKKQINRFGWTITAEGAEDAPGPITQTSAVLRYHTQGQQDITNVTIDDSQNYYDFPANTFTADDIEWQVEVTINTGATGTSEWIHVNTQDALSTPVCISPVGVVVDDTNGISFVWEHAISTGTEQTAYELQTSTNMGGQYTTLSTEESNVSHFDTPAGTFEQGTLMWRVRTKNGDGEWGSYSAAATIIIRRAPATPVIVYTDTKPRPTIRWQSADQQGVRIQIGEYDTGWMHSTAKEFRMPLVLPDGVYSVRLTIKTIFGVESAAATGTITVKNLAGPDITAAFQIIESCIVVEWQQDDAYQTYYLLQNGDPIARTNGNTYTDRLSNGMQEYVVRGITADGYYGDSAPVYAYLPIENAVLGSVEEGDAWISLRLRRGERPTHDANYSVQTTLVHYYGRKKPVAYTNGMEDASHDLSFTVKPQIAQQLRELVGQTVVYKDRWGSVVVGVLDSIRVLQDRMCDVEFSITETDYIREVAYEDD